MFYEFSAYFKAFQKYLRHSLNQDLETGCQNRGFIDFWGSKVWYKVHTTNDLNPIKPYAFFRQVSALFVL